MAFDFVGIDDLDKILDGFGGGGGGAGPSAAPRAAGARAAVDRPRGRAPRSGTGGATPTRTRSGTRGEETPRGGAGTPGRRGQQVSAGGGGRRSSSTSARAPAAGRGHPQPAATRPPAPVAQHPEGGAVSTPGRQHHHNHSHNHNHPAGTRSASTPGGRAGGQGALPGTPQQRAAGAGGSARHHSHSHIPRGAPDDDPPPGARRASYSEGAAPPLGFAAAGDAEAMLDARADWRDPRAATGDTRSASANPTHHNFVAKPWVQKSPSIQPVLQYPLYQAYADILQTKRMGLPLVQRLIAATGTGCCNVVQVREPQERSGNTPTAKGKGGVWSTNTAREKHAECTLHINQKAFTQPAPRDAGYEAGTKFMYNAKIHLLTDNAVPTIGKCVVAGGQHPKSGLAVIDSFACFQEGQSFRQQEGGKEITLHRQSIPLDGRVLTPYLKLTFKATRREYPGAGAASTHRIVFLTVVRDTTYHVIPPERPRPHGHHSFMSAGGGAGVQGFNPASAFDVFDEGVAHNTSAAGLAFQGAPAPRGHSGNDGAAFHPPQAHAIPNPAGYHEGSGFPANARGFPPAQPGHDPTPRDDFVDATVDDDVDDDAERSWAAIERDVAQALKSPDDASRAQLVPLRESQRTTRDAMAQSDMGGSHRSAQSGGDDHRGDRDPGPTYYQHHHHHQMATGSHNDTVRSPPPRRLDADRNAGDASGPFARAAVAAPEADASANDLELSFDPLREALHAVHSAQVRYRSAPREEPEEVDDNDYDDQCRVLSHAAMRAQAVGAGRGDEDGRHASAVSTSGRFVPRATAEPGPVHKAAVRAKFRAAASTDEAGGEQRRHDYHDDDDRRIAIEDSHVEEMLQDLAVDAAAAERYRERIVGGSREDEGSALAAAVPAATTQQSIQPPPPPSLPTEGESLVRASTAGGEEQTPPPKGCKQPQPHGLRGSGSSGAAATHRDPRARSVSEVPQPLDPRLPQPHGAAGYTGGPGAGIDDDVLSPSPARHHLRAHGDARGRLASTDLPRDSCQREQRMTQLRKEMLQLRELQVAAESAFRPVHHSPGAGGEEEEEDDPIGVDDERQLHPRPARWHHEPHARNHSYPGGDDSDAVSPAHAPQRAAAGHPRHAPAAATARDPSPTPPREPSLPALRAQGGGGGGGGVAAHTAPPPAHASGAGVGVDDAQLAGLEAERRQHQASFSSWQQQQKTYMKNMRQHIDSIITHLSPQRGGSRSASASGAAASTTAAHAHAAASAAGSRSPSGGVGVGVPPATAVTAESLTPRRDTLRDRERDRDAPGSTSAWDRNNPAPSSRAGGASSSISPGAYGGGGVAAANKQQQQQQQQQQHGSSERPPLVPSTNRTHTRVTDRPPHSLAGAGGDGGVSAQPQPQPTPAMGVGVGMGGGGNSFAQPSPPPQACDAPTAAASETALLHQQVAALQRQVAEQQQMLQRQQQQQSEPPPAHRSASGSVGAGSTGGGWGAVPVPGYRSSTPCSTIGVVPSSRSATPLLSHHLAPRGASAEAMAGVPPLELQHLQQLQQGADPGAMAQHVPQPQPQPQPQLAVEYYGAPVAGAGGPYLSPPAQPPLPPSYVAAGGASTTAPLVQPPTPTSTAVANGFAPPPPATATAGAGAVATAHGGFVPLGNMGVGMTGVPVAASHTAALAAPAYDAQAMATNKEVAELKDRIADQAKKIEKQEEQTQFLIVKNAVQQAEARRQRRLDDEKLAELQGRMHGLQAGAAPAVSAAKEAEPKPPVVTATTEQAPVPTALPDTAGPATTPAPVEAAAPSARPPRHDSRGDAAMPPEEAAPAVQPAPAAPPAPHTQPPPSESTQMTSRSTARWGGCEATPNTLQTTASVCITFNRLRDELLAGCDTSDRAAAAAALSQRRFALNPYCKPGTLQTLLNMTRVSVFVFTSTCFVEHVAPSPTLTQKELRETAWATLCGHAPAQIRAVTRTDEVAVLGRAVLPSTDPGAPEQVKYFVVFNTSVDVAVNSLKLVAPQFPWFRVHCLLDFEERCYDLLIKDVVALAPSTDAGDDSSAAAAGDGDGDDLPGLRYYTDLTEDHPVVPFFQGGSTLDAFIWDDLSYSGYYDYSDAGSMLELVVRPHVQTLHYWRRSSRYAASTMAVMLVHGTFASQVMTESFDGVVLSRKNYSLLCALVGEPAVARLGDTLYVVPDDFFTTDTDTAAKRFLELCAARGWSQVATTVFEREHGFSDNDLMDSIFEWSAACPSFITIFHSHKDDFKSIKDGFRLITSDPHPRAKRAGGGVTTDSMAFTNPSATP